MTTQSKLRFYNTETRNVDEFKSIKDGEVKMYCCGPTVYNYPHIGNFKAYIFEDILRKTIKRAGYKITHVMNITDVGHLTGDDDSGEDKMLVAAKREQKDVLEIARYYENCFFEDSKLLNIERPEIVCRATEHIDDMIKFIEGLDKKGYVYIAGGNVYYDTSKFENYGKMAGLKLDSLIHGYRVNADDNKKNPTDFVLWFTKSKFENHILSWKSPWGEGGYPGWNIECSTMAMKYLGDRMDIHCGGVDHINMHHTNEIAQSEGLTGHKWVNFWMHCAFLEVKSGKMSKSSGEFLTLKFLKEKGYEPLSYRYLCLTAHYLSPLAFTYESLDSADTAYKKLREQVIQLRENIASGDKVIDEKTVSDYNEKFNSFLFDDLNTSLVISNIWILLKDKSVSSATKLAILEQVDEVISLGIKDMVKDNTSLEIPDEVKNIIEERKLARQNKDWKKSDELRDILLNKYSLIIKDLPTGEVELKKA